MEQGYSGDRVGSTVVHIVAAPLGVFITRTAVADQLSGGVCLATSVHARGIRVMKDDGADRCAWDMPPWKIAELYPSECHATAGMVDDNQ